MTERYRLLGGPGSPYSMKVRALLRYRHIPHVWLVPRGYLSSDGELARADKKLLPVMRYPDGGYRADSTPMARELETLHPGQRSVLPDEPGLAFLSHLIEDLADEVMMMPMFFLRWGSDADRAFCARRQMSGWLSPMPARDFEALVDRFTERQVANRAKWTGADNESIMAELLLRWLAVMEQLPEHSLFLFGSRPSLADFALYGQLSQYTVDPSASMLMRQHAPRTFQWTLSLEDASGIDGEWTTPERLPPTVGDLLDLCASHHLPLLLAHAQGCAEDRSDVEIPMAGRRWMVKKPERYKQRCLLWLRHDLAQVPEDSMRWLRPLLRAHGCWDLLQRDEMDAAMYKPMAPL